MCRVTAGASSQILEAAIASSHPPRHTRTKSPATVSMAHSHADRISHDVPAMRGLPVVQGRAHQLPPLSPSGGALLRCVHMMLNVFIHRYCYYADVRDCVNLIATVIGVLPMLALSSGTRLSCPTV